MALQTNIYDNQIYFSITHNGEVTYILEPMGWDKISCRIPRDPTYYGFWSDFIEDKYGMLFTFILDETLKLTGGAKLLKTIYETPGQGANSDVVFSIGVMNFNTPQEINNWRINMNTYECDFGGVSVSIEKMPFQGKLRARMSAPCTINEHTNMDGGSLTQIPTYQVRMHSKTLLEQTEFSTSNPKTSNVINSNLDSYFVFQPDQENSVSNELSTVFNQPCGLIDTTSGNPSASGTPQPANVSGLDRKPFSDLISQYSPDTSGFLTVTWSGSGILYYWKNSGGSMGWAVTPRVVVQRLIAGVQTIQSVSVGTTKNLTVTSLGFAPPTPPIIGIFPFSLNGASQQYLLKGLSGSTNRANCVKIENWSFSEVFTNIQVERGDNVYVELIMCPPFTGGGINGYCQFDQFINDIKYEQLTTTPGTTANGYRIFDVFNQLVENVTGQKNSISTSFFDNLTPSPLSPGTKYMIMNGYSIRNFGANIYQPKITLQSFLDSIQSIFCVGYGIKRNITTGLERLFIGYISDFFKTRTIRRYEDTFEWKDNYSQKYVYNKIELGYDKWEGLNLVQQDEFNTNGYYLLQTLKYGDNTLTKKSGLIASGYLIEEQRRNQFLSNPGQTLTNDNDIFIVATNEPCVFNQINVIFGTTVTSIQGVDYYQILFGVTSMVLEKGDIIVSSSGLNAGIQYLIEFEVDGYPIIGEDRYYTKMLPIGEIISTDITIIPSSPNQIFAERNQPFKICSGCIDPTTIYNGRLSLKHIRANWRPILGIGLDQVDVNSQDYASSQIVTSLVKMNSSFTTQYLPTEDFKGNVGNMTLNEFVRDRIKDYLSIGSNIFSSTGSTCKIRVGWNDVNDIRHAICGETGDDTIDFGGLELKDDFGDFWFCHVMDMNYNLKDETLTLTLQKVKKVL